MRLHPIAIVAVGALALAGCSGSDKDTASSGSGTKITLTVMAAASLQGTFTAMGKTFEAANPGTTVTFNFGPSSGLGSQITSGAAADVFASASNATMDTVVKAGDAVNPKTFAKNEMEIAVPANNPAKIAALDDLAASGVKVSLCQAEVPCGTVAAKVFANAGLTVKPVSEDVDVKAVLTRVSLGEVDAGVVYVTDVLAAGDKVKGIEIPANVNASTAYPIAVLKASKSTAMAQKFVDYVLSADGQKVLQDAGFAAP